MLIKIKKPDNFDYEKNKLFIMVILNSTPETMTKQQMYYEKNPEKCIEKGKQHYQESKDRLQKIPRNRYRRLSEEEKHKREY